MNLKSRTVAVVASMLILSGTTSLKAFTLPPLPPLPPLATPLAPNSVPMGSAAGFPEANMTFAIETNGPFAPTWQSIAANVPGNGTPAWLRAAKFGIWFHYGPQANLASGDWSAQHMYQQGATAYDNHLNNFGHPTTNGFKDVIRAWNPTNYNPAGLAQLFHDAGARFVMVQGVHHDNFDTWNSQYNPWNMVNFGARRDTMAEWTNALHTLGMRYGVAFHHEYSWWFYQPAFLSDGSGPLAGVPYDAITATNSAGQWWTNRDTRMLYGRDLHEYQGITTPNQGYWNPGSGIFTNHLAFCDWYATQWALRMLDVVENYDPDFIYTDGNSTQPFSGFATGTGYKCDAMQRVIAHYYNRTLQRRGQLDTLAVVKFHNGDRIGTTFEGNFSSTIKSDQPWFAEFAIGDWFYKPGISYDSGGTIVHRLLEAVCRDGATMVNIPNRPDGALDSGATNMLVNVGQWMAMHGEGIYGSRAWVKPTDGSFRFTVGTNGFLYAYYFGTPSAGTQLTIPSLATTSNLLVAPITSVSLLGSAAALAWSQTSSGLVVTCPTPMPSVPAGTAIGFKIGPASAIGSAVPNSVLALPATNAINVSWYHPSAGAAFKVKRATTSGGAYTTIASNLTTYVYADTNAATNTLYFYVVTATDAAGESVNSTETSGARVVVPASNWLSQDIGAVGATGSFSQSDGVLTVLGSGGDIWYEADEFRYAFQAVSGDYMLTARVTNMQNTAAWAKAGVMMRESLSADSKYVINFMSPANGVALQQRASTGGSASGVADTTGVTVPYWVRLVRFGNNFSAYRSPDGVNWTLLGSTSVSLNANYYVGLAVCSVNDGTLNQSIFDNVSITVPQTPGAVATLSAAAGDGMVGLSWPAAANATTYNVKRATSSSGPYTTIAAGVANTVHLDTGLANGTTYYYVVTATNGLGEGSASPEASATPGALTLSSPWLQTDVGAVAAAGNGGNANGSFFIQGSGADVWFAADEFHFVYISLTNDCSITAHVPYVQNVQNTSKAGVMIRETTNTDSKHALVDVTPTTTLGVEFIRRTGAGGGTTADGSPGVTAPHWVRLTRTGDSFAAFRSADGLTWTAVGSPVTVVMSSNVLVGLAVNSHLDGALCQAWFDNVRWTPAALPGAPIWISATVGDGQATLNWASSVNATGYHLKRSTTNGGPYTTVATNTAGTSFLDTGLANGTAYYYVVSATNAAGESANSMQIAVQPVSSAPLTFSYGVNGNQLQLSWPLDHRGWRLETQTNALATGLGTNWVTVPGSSATNQMTLPIGAGNASVFFRLIYP
jgi:alpha-L-fucosidase